jgi:hypothetical protein
VEKHFISLPNVELIRAYGEEATRNVASSLMCLSILAGEVDILDLSPDFRTQKRTQGIVSHQVHLASKCLFESLTYFIKIIKSSRFGEKCNEHIDITLLIG